MHQKFSLHGFGFGLGYGDGDMGIGPGRSDSRGSGLCCGSWEIGGTVREREDLATRGRMCQRGPAGWDRDDRWERTDKCQLLTTGLRLAPMYQSTSQRNSSPKNKRHILAAEESSSYRRETVSEHAKPFLNQIDKHSCS
jgi:hypothetical protein